MTVTHLFNLFLHFCFNIFYFRNLFYFFLVRLFSLSFFTLSYLYSPNSAKNEEHSNICMEILSLLRRFLDPLNPNIKAGAFTETSLTVY
jgi:hypothetical protein